MDVKTYTRKQAGVIYRAVKEGKLRMSRGAVAEMYDNAEYVEIFSRNSLDRANELRRTIKSAIDAIFAGDYDEAQKELDYCFFETVC